MVFGILIHFKVLLGKNQEGGKMLKRFPKEINGRWYLFTNWRIVNGTIQISKGKFWKFPLKKRAV